MTRRRIAAGGLLITVALVAGACGNAWGVHNAASGESPGVTPTEIIVGGVASITSPVGDNFKYAAQGVKAYFEMVNSEGGVYGRKLRLVAEYDDNTQASKNIAAVRT